MSDILQTLSPTLLVFLVASCLLWDASRPWKDQTQWVVWLRPALQSLSPCQHNQSSSNLATKGHRGGKLKQFDLSKTRNLLTLTDILKANNHSHLSQDCKQKLLIFSERKYGQPSCYQRWINQKSCWTYFTFTLSIFSTMLFFNRAYHHARLAASTLIFRFNIFIPVIYFWARVSTKKDCCCCSC